MLCGKLELKPGDKAQAEILGGTDVASEITEIQRIA